MCEPTVNFDQAGRVAADDHHACLGGEGQPVAVGPQPDAVSALVLAVAAGAEVAVAAGPVAGQFLRVRAAAAGETDPEVRAEWSSRISGC